jgi:hypothetical protein
VVVRATPIAGVVIRKTHTIRDAQMRDYVLQTRWRIVEDNLLEGMLLLANIFDVVVADTHIEYITAIHWEAFIAIVDMLGSVQNVADSITRQDDRSDIRRRGVCELYDFRLRLLVGLKNWHNIIVIGFITLFCGQNYKK